MMNHPGQPSPQNLITSPAFMWYPGNIYHHALSSDVGDADVHCDSSCGHTLGVILIGAMLATLIVLLIHRAFHGKR